MESPVTTQFRSSRLFTVGFALALFFIVVGAKWAAIDRFASDIPFWDQWDAEDLHLLVPWFETNNFVHELFLPQNEHRVILTKLQSLALVLASGQWDARLECVVNALMPGALAVAIWLLGRRWLAPMWQALLFILLAALLGLPFAWENVISGFHSQQFWLLGLSFATMVTFPFVRAWTAAWWAAAATAALTLLTMGSGFFAAAVVLGVVAFRVFRSDVALRAAWPTLAVCAALIGVGVLTRVEVPYHADLKAKTVHDFVFYILHSLQWPTPLSAGSFAALVLWLPWFILAWQVLRAPRGINLRPAQTIAAMGGWVLLQIVATAYARGAGADYPASRYMDTVGFGMAANGLALGWHCARRAPSDAWKFGRVAFALIWFGTIAWGLYGVSRFAIMEGMPERKGFFFRAEAATRAFLVTNDRADLIPDEIPYPSPDALVQRLAHPAVRALMPLSVRPPLALLPATRDNGVFLENHAAQRSLNIAPHYGLPPAVPALGSRITWGSFGPTGAAATGEWTSAPLTAPLGGWLAFETSGQLGESGVALELHDAQAGALLATVCPSRVPLDTWRTAYVRAPRAPFVVVARDEDSHRWLAFSAPVEMSSLSYFAWQAAKHGLLIAGVGAGAALLLSLAVLGRETDAQPLPR